MLCTKDRKILFDPIVGADSISAREDSISAPTVSEIVQAFKRYSTIEYIKMVKKGIVPPFEKQIWQRSFYDHIIRNHDDYNEVFRYIRENPMRWKADRFNTDA